MRVGGVSYGSPPPGHSESGKTTLVDALDRLQEATLKQLKKSMGKATQTAKPQEPPPAASADAPPKLQSTVGVNQTQWELFSADLDSGGLGKYADVMPVSVLDFAGQLEYLTTHKVRDPISVIGLNDLIIPVLPTAGRHDLSPRNRRVQAL